MNIRFEGSLTKDEFKNSIKLANRPILKYTGFHFDLWIILLLAGIVIIAYGLRMLFIEEKMSSGVMVAVTGAIVFSFGMKTRKAIERAWDEFQKTDTKREGVITDDYLETRSSVGNSQTLWTGISGYGEYQNMIVLFQSGVAYPFSPRFFQNETDWQEFRKFISNKLPITHKVQPGFINSSNWFVWLLLILSVALMIFYAILKETKS